MAEVLQRKSADVIIERVKVQTHLSVADQLLRLRMKLVHLPFTLFSIYYVFHDVTIKRVGYFSAAASYNKE